MNNVRKIEIPKGMRDHYRDLCMMRDVVHGVDYKTVAMLWGCTVRTARGHVKGVAMEMMRLAMVNTQGIPEHPATMRFRIEEFTADPRACMVAMMNDEIRKLEERFPDIIRKEVDENETG